MIEFFVALIIFSSPYSLTQVQIPNEWPSTELGCLAANIYYEARGESEKGQYLVGFVTLNRVKHSRFPNTICGVVKQPKQFSWYSPTKLHYPSDKKAWKQAKEVAINILYGQDCPYKDITKGAMFYHASYVKPYWAKKKYFQFKVGNHLFYHHEDNT